MWKIEEMLEEAMKPPYVPKPRRVKYRSFPNMAQALLCVHVEESEHCCIHRCADSLAPSSYLAGAVYFWALFIVSPAADARTTE